MSDLMDLTTQPAEPLFSPAEAACLNLRRGLVRVRAVEPHAVGATVLVDLGADDVPPLAEVEDAMVRRCEGLRGPALRRDADASGLPHALSLSADAGVRTGPSGRGLRTPTPARCQGRQGARSGRSERRLSGRRRRRRTTQARLPSATIAAYLIERASVKKSVNNHGVSGSRQAAADGTKVPVSLRP